jgi:hypothetical protein
MRDARSGARAQRTAATAPSAVQPAAFEQRGDLGGTAAEVSVGLERILRPADAQQARRKRSPFSRVSPPFSRNHSTVSASSTSLQMYE